MNQRRPDASVQVAGALRSQLAKGRADRVAVQHLTKDDLVDWKGDEDVDDGGAEAAQVVAELVIATVVLRVMRRVIGLVVVLVVM